VTSKTAINQNGHDQNGQKSDQNGRNVSKQNNNRKVQAR